MGRAHVAAANVQLRHPLCSITLIRTRRQRAPRPRRRWLSAKPAEGSFSEYRSCPSARRRRTRLIGDRAAGSGQVHATPPAAPAGLPRVVERQRMQCLYSRTGYGIFSTTFEQVDGRMGLADVPE